MDSKREFSAGDYVRVKQGPFAFFVGKVVRVDNASQRVTVEGSFEGESGPSLNTINVGFSVVEKIERTRNEN